MSGLKVAGAGLPRTSTLSLKTALEILEITPCYHVMTHVLPHIKTQGPAWIEISKELNKEKRQKMIRGVFEGNLSYENCIAAVDGPSCFVIDDFLELYPGIKIICSVRDSPQAWHKSFRNSVGLAFGRPLIYWLGWWESRWIGIFHFNEGMNELVKRRYGVDIRDIETYDKHLEWVKKVVPKDRLLIHNAKDGWESLCKFLDVPVPDCPYPRVNDTLSLKKTMGAYFQMGLLRWGIIFGTVIAVVIAYWWRGL